MLNHVIKHTYLINDIITIFILNMLFSIFENYKSTRVINLSFLKFYVLLVRSRRKGYLLYKQGQNFVEMSLNTNEKKKVKNDKKKPEKYV